MADLDDIYSARILELAGAISHVGRLDAPDAPDATAIAHSKLCGSTVTVDMVVKDGRVEQFAQIVKACLLGQAACSVVAREIVGTTATELRTIGRQMRAMLKSNGAPPEGRWSDLAVLAPVRDYKGRHASVLLVFDAVETALSQIPGEIPGENPGQISADISGQTASLTAAHNDGPDPAALSRPATA